MPAPGEGAFQAQRPEMLGVIAGQQEDLLSKEGKSEAGWGGQRPGHGVSTLAMGLS